MENQEIKRENEEISIIDLIAVLLKYRKLIILGTIIPTVCTVLWLFVAEPIIKNKIKIEQTTEIKTETKVVYTVQQNYKKPKVYSGLADYCGKGMDVGGTFIKDFQNYKILTPLYEKYKFADTVTNEDTEVLIKNWIKNQQFSCVASDNNTFTITIFMPIKSLDQLELFIQSFVQYEIDFMEKMLFGENLDYLEARCRRRLSEVENADPKTVNFTEIQYVKDILEDIEFSRNENKPSFEILGKPVIEKSTITPPAPPKEPKVKELIIVAVASLFIFIFIAFLLNAIQNIKDDPVSSQKIKDAWKAGKK